MSGPVIHHSQTLDGTSQSVRTILVDLSGNPYALSSGGDGAVLDGVSAAIKASVLDYANSNPLAVRLTDTTGAYATQPVSAASLPLPTGASTAANQSSILTELGDKLDEATFTGRLGEVQATPTANTLLARLKTIADNQLPDSHNVTVDNASIAVTGTFWQATQPVSAASLPLPSGASTAANQATSNTHLSTIAGAVAGTEMQVDVLTMPSVTANLAGDDTDLDSGAGTDSHDVVAIGLPASGGHAVGGTSTNPLRTDPTGTTIQPVSGTVTANAGSGTFTVGGTVTANAGTGTFTVGGSVTANAGTNLNTSALALESGGNLATVAGLSRAEDAGHATGDSGIMALSVRSSSATALAGSNLDYQPLITDASGRLYTTATIDAALPAGTNAIGKLAANSGVDIGDVDVTSVPADPFGANADAASATGSISAKLRFIAVTGIPITGTVNVANAGTFAVQAAQTTNPWLVAGRKQAASTNAPTQFANLGANATLNVKASAGNVFSLYCNNENAAARFIQLHNTATTPAAGATPLYTFRVPAEGDTLVGTDFFTNEGGHFSTGIAFAFSTTKDTYTAGTAGDQSTIVMYV